MGKTKRKKRTIARICSMIGVSLLILVILICIPLTLPRLTGFDIYTVVTGSMEPAIPVGSLIYVREEAPAELMEGEVVAYRSDTDAGIIITHRVVKNQVVSGQLITKGDANEAEDVSPVSYAQEKHHVIRQTLKELYGEAADQVPTLYGGSVNLENATQLFAQPDIDGLYVGRVAWDAKRFARLITDCLARGKKQ